MKRFVIIDANALIHRAFHSMPVLTDKNGQPTNAVYGFISVFIRMLSQLKPDYVVAAFDLPQPTFRHKEFAAYKANRPKTPQDLESQIPKVKEILRAFGVPILEKPGFEADDIIGAVTKKVEDYNSNKKSGDKILCLVLTGDLDTLQLVSKSVRIYTFKRGITETAVYDREALKKRFGLKPEQIVDMKALKGDPSDNIPGVKGIGEKGAVKLLQKFGSLDNIFKILESRDKNKIPKRFQNLLEKGKKQAYFSRELAVIIRDIELPGFSFEKALWGGYNKKEVEKALLKYGFRSLLRRLNGGQSSESPATSQVRFKTVSSDKELKEFLRQVKRRKVLGIALGPSGTALGTDKANMVFLKKEFFERSVEILRGVFEDPKTKKIGSGLKQVYTDLSARGVDLEGISFDIQIASWLLNPDRRNFALPTLSEPEKLAQIFDLKEKSEKLIKKQGLSRVFNKIEIPLIPVLAKMEARGIKLDLGVLEEKGRRIRQELGQLQGKIYSQAGCDFNINSPRQLSEVLFKKLKLPTENLRKTPGRALSTRESELLKLKNLHPIIGLILRWRQLEKLKDTYIDALPNFIDKRGRIHPRFIQTGTSTGRLSCAEPNLQNLPPEIRRAFVSEAGFSLVSFDFAQAELRIIANLAGDKEMSRIFEKGEDIHTATACQIYSVKPREVTSEMRRTAKALNFGIIYGLSPFGLSEMLGISRQEAERYIESYLRRFPGVAGYITKAKEEVRKKLFAQTLLGRKRFFPFINSSGYRSRAAAEREAINMPIQGTVADITKLAMIKISRFLQKARANRETTARKGSLFEVHTSGGEDAFLILQIHDELIFEIKDEKLNQYIPKIKEIMEKVWPLKIPMKVSVSFGKDWGKLK